MAGELQASYTTGRTCYFLVRDTSANIYSQQFGGFSGYSSSLYSGYAISAVEQGTSAYYTGNFPGVAANTYNAVMKQAITGVPLESDPTVDAGSLNWGGSGVFPLTGVAASGVAQTIQLRRSWMVKNYPIYLRSSADHTTPFVSGNGGGAVVVSGSISKDGATSIGLQSGAFTPINGQPGFYSLQALTSGDLTANVITLLFTAVNLSGGTSDPLPQSFILQQSSGG